MSPPLHVTALCLRWAVVLAMAGFAWRRKKLTPWIFVAMVAGAELGSHTKRVGFYSYGEIAPMAHSGTSEVHNETMTITTLFEYGSSGGCTGCSRDK